MNYKNYVRKSIVLIVALLFVIGVINYKIDPFQQFNITPYGRGEQRKINPGIARNYRFQTVIIGTSTSQNVLRDDVEKFFPDSGRAVNLSMSGSTQYEQESLLRLALKHNDIKRVIYGMDMFSYVGEKGRVRSRIPDYLYGEELFPKYSYLLSLETLNRSFSGLSRGLKRKKGEDWIAYNGANTKLDSYNELNTMRSAKFQGEVIANVNYDFENMKNNYDEFLKLAKEYPEVKVDIYFVPYSFIWWYFAEKHGKLKNLLKDRGTNIQKIQIIHHEKNVGIVKNFNDAIKVSSGEFIFPLAGDDSFFDENTVKDIVDTFGENEMAVTGLRAVFDENMKNFKAIEPMPIARYFLKKSVKDMYEFTLLKGCKTSGASSYYRRKMFDQFGFFDENSRLVEDFSVSLTLLRNSIGYKLLDKPVIKYRDGGVSNNKAPNPQMVKDRKYILEKELSLTKENKYYQDLINYSLMDDKKERKEKFKKIYILDRFYTIFNSLLKHIYTNRIN